MLETQCLGTRASIVVNFYIRKLIMSYGRIFESAALVLNILSRPAHQEELLTAIKTGNRAKVFDAMAVISAFFVVEGLRELIISVQGASARDVMVAMMSQDVKILANARCHTLAEEYDQIMGCFDMEDWLAIDEMCDSVVELSPLLQEMQDLVGKKLQEFDLLGLTI